MMHMTFYWGKQATILFDGWRTQTWTGYAVSLVAVFLFAVFHEFVVSCRLSFASAAYNWATAAIPHETEKFTFLLKWSSPQSDRLHRTLEAALFGVNAATGYLLMLAVMSFNGGVFIAIVVGFAVGYWSFRNNLMNVVSDSQPCESCA